mgnify:CR=1 FL=1
MVRCSSLLLLLTSACWVTESEVVYKATLDVPFVPELVIEEIVPNYGWSKGSQEVAIHMLQRCGSPVVKMGSKSAIVLEQSEVQLVVRTPPLEGGQWVDVVVQCDEGVGTLDRGFQVFQDATGQVRSTGEFSWVEHIGDYWVDSVEDYGYAAVYMFEPIMLEYSSFFGSRLDRCESEYNRGTVGIDSMAELMDELELSSGQESVVLPYQESDGWYYSELTAEQYSRNVVYDLEPFGTLSPWSKEVVEDFIETPSGNMAITKPEMDAASPPIVRSEFDLAWPGAGQGDYVFGMITRFNRDDSYEQVRCLLRDDGHFRVEASVFEDWQSGEVMTIRLGRVKRPSGVFPQDGASSGVVGVDWVKGAGYQY